MAWLWSSWKEYVDYVHPTTVTSQGLFRAATHGSWFETQQKLINASQELAKALSSLKSLRYDEESGTSSHSSDPDNVYGMVVHLIRAGEELLLYHKRLALSDASYGFLHMNDIADWERYKGTNNISWEIKQLVKDTDELLDGYSKVVQADEDFLVRNLKLPPELEGDFLLARNLFSVGFDEAGVLIAGRGLEGVLRKIAVIRKVMIVTAKGDDPASEARFHDLIEVMARLRWKVQKSLLVSSQTKALLHYLRELRNRGAHPNIKGTSPQISHREIAAIVADTANQLWQDITGTRARLEQTHIKRTW